MAGEKLNPLPLLVLPPELEEPEFALDEDEEPEFALDDVLPESVEGEPESYDPLAAEEPESGMVESAVESTSPPVEVVPESELLGPKLGLLL